MSLLHAVAIFAAGIVAGTINTVVGSGTLFTFPGPARVRLRARGRQRLQHRRAGPGLGQRGPRLPARAGRAAGTRLLRLAVASVAGGLLGAVLLLELPASAFKAIVPIFIALALVMIVAQPRLSACLAGPAFPRA